ncbi:hypothetical protein D9611_000243 [Ephemerocybe angulata]|uniref:Uncharacterized protein n=2 Tax=Ephemerocybe angulata TaxID=980116 RepID=A0A8H5BMA7_9AGAR|nr:hypothetical protein D9611_000243 [Tulosesus angulatus]KAF6762982.1 hypothetical protein DFP72DRAFT_519154 [Tulosesus angulatus]
MHWQSLAAFVALVLPGANALIRFPCAQLVTERLDPLVDPGRVSAHVHQVIGGNAFNITMDETNDINKIATCTSCKFKENKSNYWTAVMYFKHTNGTFTRVPQKPNHLTGSPNGGMTVYYINPPKGTKVTQFPKGFRMITGNPMLRARKAVDTTSPEAFSLSFRCWETTGFTDASNSSPPGVGRYDTVNLPNKKCNGGIRANIFFPSCWNGKDLNPPDHSSHMAFFQGRVDTNAGIILMNGNCPSTHPVRMPLLFFETAWDTAKFNDQWPTDGSQPFVLSMGDPTGYGQHGDYVFGWEGNALQTAMDNCFDTLGLPDSCKQLTQQSDADMNNCRVNTVVNERVEDSFLSALPGCNPIQNGPNPATMAAGCGAISTTGTGAAPTQTQTQTTTTQTQSTTTTTTVVQQPTAPAGPAVPKYGQCGGNGWTGSTTCVSGSTCTKLNDWYSQCT